MSRRDAPRSERLLEEAHRRHRRALQAVSVVAFSVGFALGVFVTLALTA